MSSITDIIAFDGAATPVSHTLKAISVTKEKGVINALWMEKLPSVPDYAQVSLLVTMRKLNSGVYRVSSRASVPVMESVSGVNSSGYTAAPRVAYTDTIETIGYFSERGLLTGRRLARQLSTNVMGGIATTVAPVTTGPIAELFDLLIAPT